MATSKTLAPTNVTIQIPAMTDAPDQSVNSNCIDKLGDAVNTLNSQITPGQNINIADESALRTALASMIENTPSYGMKYFVMRTLDATGTLSIPKASYACFAGKTSAGNYGEVLLVPYSNNNIYKFRYNAGVSNESYITQISGTEIARW